MLVWYGYAVVTAHASVAGRNIILSDNNSSIGKPAATAAVSDTTPAAPSVDSCAGPTALLSVLDRPTISDSVCSVKKNKAFIELGYTYQMETGNEFQTLSTLPQPEIRYGAGHNIELKLFPPNYIHQSLDRVNRTAIRNGYNDAGLGAKYEFGYGEKWGIATDTAVTFASGSRYFSANGTGVTLNGILAYNVNEDIGVGLQIGLSHLFSPAYAAQETMLTMDIVLTDQLNRITGNLQLYAECYSTIDIMRGTGITSFVDAGMQYLLSQNIEIDLEAGHNLTDLPYHNTTYVGFGTGLEF